MILLVSFVSSVVSVVTATIASAFGPSLALTGSDSKTILYGKGSYFPPSLFSSNPSDAIHTRIRLCPQWCICCDNGSIPCCLQVFFPLLTFFPNQFFSFATFPLGPAIMTTIFCIVGTVLLISESSLKLPDSHSLCSSRKGSKYFAKCSSKRKEIS